MKLRGLLGGLSFAPVEFTFTTLTAEVGEKGHTTLEQFAANCLFLPWLFEIYYHLTLPYNALVFGMCFPIFVWVLEIIEGYYMIFLYGYNPAWHYHGNDAFFHGMLTELIL